MDERLMSDEAVEDAVLRYLEESPEVVSGVAPSRDLWPGIEARIGARVLPLGRDSVEVRSIRRRPPWLAMAAAAAVLVASSASVTYLLTKRFGATSSPAQVAATRTDHVAPAAPAPTTEPSSTAAPSQVASTASTEPTDRDARTPTSSAGTQRVGERTAPAARMVARDPSASLVSYPATGSDEARVTYDDEINRLHAVLESRRDQLDSTTVATVEQNLHVIDVAIAQARAALARDPHSRMLNEQLDRTLAKKTQLLRAATLLPSV
jgi:hypothetical protein